MPDTARLLGTTNSTSAIQSMIWQAFDQQVDVNFKVKIRRMAISQDGRSADRNATGTVLPAPYDQTTLALHPMSGAAAKATFISASRLTSNPPDIAVIPLSTRSAINVTVDKNAGEQERLDAQMLYECGMSDNLWEAAWAKSVGGAAFHLVLPRDTDFGLPDRMYVDESDDEIDALKAAGRYAPFKRALPTGQMVYSERGDVWAARRKEYMRDRAVSVNGRSLFTWTVYPRDQVLKERDREAKDLKWAAIIEEIHAYQCKAGSDFAMNLAKMNGVKADDQGLWGIFWDSERKRIIGGIPEGGPLGSQKAVYDSFTLIRYFNREEVVILVAPRGTVQGATELWRGKHGCTVMGVPSCPVVEDPFYRTDIPVTGKEYASFLDPVFGWVPLVTQLLTLESNIAAVNGIPRRYGELQNGATVREDSGEPNAVRSSTTPGLDPEQVAWFPGQIHDLLINDESLREMLKIALEQLAENMPSLAGEASGADAAAWAIMQRAQESQQPFEKPVSNGCQALTGIIQRMHGWLRKLDTPVYFWAAPGHRKNTREIRGLVEYDPKNLTDSIMVTQDLATQSESTVRTQVGMQLWEAGVIDDEELAEKYLREQDTRAFVLRRWVQLLTNYIMQGILPPPPPGTQQSALSILQIVGDGVRGEVHYEMIQTNDNYAVATGMQILAQSQQAMMAQQGQARPQQGGTPQAAGAPPTSPDVPGNGMALTLQGQTGGPPGGAQMPQTVGV